MHYTLAQNQLNFTLLEKLNYALRYMYRATIFSHLKIHEHEKYIKNKIRPAPPWGIHTAISHIRLRFAPSATQDVGLLLLISHLPLPVHNSQFQIVVVSILCSKL